jgi:hypothetical protein
LLTKVFHQNLEILIPVFERYLFFLGEWFLFLPSMTCEGSDPFVALMNLTVPHQLGWFLFDSFIGALFFKRKGGSTSKAEHP